MKRLTIPAVLAAAAFIAAQGREVKDLGRGWEFTDASGAVTVVDLPHDYQILQPWVAPADDERADNADGAANRRSRLSARGFKECTEGTYRRTLHIPDSLRGRRLLLDFGGIMLTGDVYLNGDRVGGTDYGYLGFECDITGTALYGADNEITVTASTGAPDNSRWYTGGGLYRDVKLVTTDPRLYYNRHGLSVATPQISIPDGGETWPLTADSARVVITGDINARADSCFYARVDIVAPDGTVAASTVERVPVNRRWRNREYTLAELTLRDAQLWDCDHPRLYRADVSLLRADGTVADSLSRTFGIRTIEYSPDFGLRLNGRKTLLKGIANHHTLGALGAAAYPRAMERRIEMLRDFGFNHIRTSHNPYSEEFLDLCDRHGMLVVDELYDKWLTQYAGGRREWTDLWQRDIPEWVRRDRSHPCVVMWSLGNELQGYNSLPYNDWGVTAYRLQKTLLERYDTTRPVTVAMHPRYRDLDTDSLPAPLALETDIASYNYRYMYFPGDSRRFPHLVFYQSEANTANMGPNFYVPDTTRVVGLAYWGMIDYLGESMGWPAKGWTNGVFDISLEPKPQAWLLKSMFSPEPVVRIGVFSGESGRAEWNGVVTGSDALTDSWNRPEGTVASLYTFTNADEVALVLNGREIGRRRNPLDDPQHRNRILWDSVPYSPGTLTAVAYNGGREAARHTIATTGEAVSLRLTPDPVDWQADGVDLMHVRVEAVDSDGRRVPTADARVDFSVDGPATIAAVSNGDMCSDELSQQPHRRLYHGSALLILRSTTTPGTVTIRATAPGLEPASLVITNY